jgi:hypothetical protein
MVTIGLSLAERCAVDEQFAINDPKNADTRLFFPALGWLVNFGGHARRSPS